MTPLGHTVASIPPGPPRRGGQRPGAGRPAGSSKPDSRRNRLTQRYSGSELQLLTEAAERYGYGDDLTAYVRDRAINGAVIGMRS